MTNNCCCSDIEVSTPSPARLSFDTSPAYEAVQRHNMDESAHPYILVLVAEKQDKINDLESIRAGALAGSTALQPSALNGYATETWVGQQGFLTSSALTGYATQQWVSQQGYLTGITSSDVTTALGYTPYNSSNPSGYISGITSAMVTTALGYTPYNSTNPSGYQANVIETVKVNGTALTPSNKAVDITVPTNNNQLTNGAGYITSSSLNGYATETWVGQQGFLTSSAIYNMQTTTNLVTSVSGSSTDSQYPSAKLFYDTCGDIETLINAL